MTLDRSTLRFFVILTLLVVCSSLIRLFHYPGPMAFDEQKWVLVAQSLVGLDVSEVHPVYHSRVLWSILLAAWATLFDWSWTALGFLVFVLSAGTVVAVAFATRAFFGDRAGILGGAFFAFHPINIIFDTSILPDTLAVFLLAIGLFFFGRYLRNFRMQDLVFSGILAGVLFSVKSYYVLYAIPFGLTVLVFRTGTQRTREFLVLVAAVLAGLTLSFSIALLSEGSLTLFHGYSDYADRIRSDSVYSGFHKWVHILLDRIDYLNDLTYHYGQAVGLFTLWAIGVLATELRRPQAFFLLFTLALFLLFLAFTPASVDPLVFIETQTRYLTVVLVPLSVGVGYALDRLAIGLQNMRLVGPGLLVFVVALGLGAWEPNNHWDRYQLMNISGVRQSLDLARNLNIGVVAVPDSYASGLPDSVRHRGNTEVSFVPMHDDGTSVLKFLMDDPKNHAVFIPREHYRQLVKDLRFGSLEDQEVNQSLKKVVLALEKSGAERLAVTVPYRSLEARLAAIGIQTRGQLVGWLFRLPEKELNAGPVNFPVMARAGSAGLERRLQPTH